MNLPGKSKSGRKKKSTQSIKTYQPNNIQRDNSVIIKIVVGAVVIGTIYTVYQNYFGNTPQPTGAQFQLVDSNAKSNTAHNNSGTVNVPVNISVPQANTTQVAIIQPSNNSGDTSNAGDTTYKSVTTIPGASGAVVPEGSGISNNQPGAMEITIEGSQNMPYEVVNQNSPLSTQGNSSTIKPGDNAQSNLDARMTTLGLPVNLRQEKLEQEQLKQLIIPSLFSLQVTLEKSIRHATGFIISPQGYALCDLKSLSGALEVKAVFADGKNTIIKEYAAVDPTSRLALLKLPASDSGYIAIPMLNSVPADGESLYLAAAVSTNNFNLQSSLLLRERKPEQLRAVLGVSPTGRWLQASLKFLAPNTGGAIIDARGNLVGIVEYQLSYGNQGTFILSSSSINDFLTRTEGNLLQQLNQDAFFKLEQDFIQHQATLQSAQQNLSYHEYERRFAVDYTNSTYANTRMAEIQQVKLMLEDFDLFPSDGSVRTNIKNIATQGLKSAAFAFNPDSPVEPLDPVIQLLIYSREGKKLDPTTKELRVQILVIVPNVNENPYTGFAKIWQSDEVSLGDVNITTANEESLPRTASEKLKDLFTSIKSLHIRSQRLLDEQKKKVDAPNIKLDQEMLENLNQPHKNNFLDDFLNRKLGGIL